MAILPSKKALLSLLVQEEGKFSLASNGNLSPVEMSQTTSEDTHAPSTVPTVGTGKHWLVIGVEALVIIILSSMLSFEYANSSFFQSYVNGYLSSFGGLVFWNLLVIVFVFATAYYAIQKQVFQG